jgi:hypothetical protein
MKRLIKIALAPVVLLVGLSLSLASACIYTYHRLTAETLIAELTFDQLADQAYRVNLATGDLCTTDAYTVYGDQWRIDARFVKWKYWANLLGFDAHYRLERLQGRYRDITEENTKPHKAHEIAEATVIDVVALAERLGKMNFLLDAEYGSSAYQEMRTDLRYLVYKTQTGIITRSKPRVAASVSAHSVTINIDKACGRPPGLWERSSGWLNRVLLHL